MKKLLLLFFVLVFFAGCHGQEFIDEVKLIERDGLIWEAKSGEPFTGTSVSYWPNGKKQVQKECRNGKLHGTLHTWYENGQEERRIEYQEGRENGEWLIWYLSGARKVAGEYRDGTACGQWTLWYEDGQKKGTWEYIGGKMINAKRWTGDGHKVVEKNALVERDGLWYEVNSDEPFTGGWFSSGDERAEGEFLAGKKHGKWTEWDEFGGTKRETEYRSGEKISEKQWDDAGNLIE